MPAEIYGPIPDDIASDEDLAQLLEDVEEVVTEFSTGFDARLDILEANTGTAIYVHIQDAPATVWTIIHNMGYYPNVTTVDTLNREIMGDEEYLDNNTVVVTFTVPIPGKAYLS